MAQIIQPNVVCHADWGSSAKKRWCAKAILQSDGHYTAGALGSVQEPGLLVRKLRQEAGDTGCAFLGFDFPIGLPEAYAKGGGISDFRSFLTHLGSGDWRDFYSVCDEPGQVSVHRPFYPNRAYKGKRMEELFRGHGASSVEPLLRRCERGTQGQKKACCLFWTLGANQVGKAAISGWRDVLVPALPDIRIWPFDGPLHSLLSPGSIVVAETFPAECYDWFGDRPHGKGAKSERKKFGAWLLRWAQGSSVKLEGALRNAIEEGFPLGGDDAFDSVVGLLGMLQVTLGQRATGEPDSRAIRDVEGWILGRKR